MGLYVEAGEKFKHCLSQDKALTKEQRSAVVDAVVEAMESGPPIEFGPLIAWCESLSRRQGDAEDVVLDGDDLSLDSIVIKMPPLQRGAVAQGGFLRHGMSHLDELRRKECVAYLMAHGMDDSVVRFYVRHRLLEDACQYIHARQVRVVPCRRVVAVSVVDWLILWHCFFFLVSNDVFTWRVVVLWRCR